LIKRIAITGPESTGKSFLAEKLEQHYHTMWVPEFARVYLDHLDRNYTYQDILFIAKSQMEIEHALTERAKGFLFCDTELIVTKVWLQWIVANIYRSFHILVLIQQKYISAMKDFN